MFVIKTMKYDIGFIQYFLGNAYMNLRKNLKCGIHLLMKSELITYGEILLLIFPLLTSFIFSSLIS